MLDLIRVKVYARSTIMQICGSGSGRILVFWSDPLVEKRLDPDFKIWANPSRFFK